MKYNIVLFVSILLAMASCAPSPELILETDQLLFSAEGETQTVLISSNGPWQTVHTDDLMRFYTLAPAGGTGNNTITITVKKNPYTRGRHGVVKFVCESGGKKTFETLKIFQDRAEPNASFTDWIKYTLSSKGAAIKTYVSYNTPWTLTCDDARVVFDPPTDMDGYYLETGEIPVTITIPENDTTEDKTYIIVLHRFYEAQEYSTATYRLLQAGKKR